MLHLFDLLKGKMVSDTLTHGIGVFTPLVQAPEIPPPSWHTAAAFVVYGFVLILGIVAFGHWQRRRIRQAERLRAEQAQAKRLAKSNRELQHALEELHSTQDQLIHAEKMASLGQLTAGIAHEIKNPLNFVNNFSRLSVDAVEELAEFLEEERSIQDEDVADLLGILKMNAEKIQEHGVRADNIVRSMLAYSRSGPGIKRPIDLNTLIDKYTNLAFHSWKAAQRTHGKKQTANPPVVERAFDPEIGEVTIVPQDIGRVIINLVNNALDEVLQKTEGQLQKTRARAKKSEQGDSMPAHTRPSDFLPKVRVRSAINGKGIEIRIADNGRGIPDTIKQKIFEPFFTTKPAGRGTGLGLSLSHDIVVNDHGGTLTVESEPGEGAEFVIRLPV